MFTTTDQLTPIPPPQTKKLLEEQRLRDVLILLKTLLAREEATVKPIIDCLYDMGSINLIDQKCKLLPVNKILKFIAKLSKPAFRIVAWHWVQRNCPQLITNWLYQQVKFSNLAQATIEVISENQPIKSDALALSPSPSQEIKYLRSQIRLLTGILIGVLATFGGSLFWISNQEPRNLTTSSFGTTQILKIRETGNEYRSPINQP